MILISHRGNTVGSNLELENNPTYIMETINKGFDVEVDVWYDGGSFFLGHDKPTYRIESYFLENTKIWCHCKNFDCLDKLKFNDNVHFFWHENDYYTLTSKNYIWSYNKSGLINNCICVLPEKLGYKINDIKNCAGVCSDHILRYDKIDNF